MSVSYLNPQAPAIPSPVGLDKELQRLQQQMATLPWLQVAYGRAVRAGRTENNKTIYYPAVYDGKAEYRDVLPNDNITAHSFFYPTGPAVNPDAASLDMGTLQLTQGVDLIVHYHLPKVDPSKNYDFGPELQRDVLRVLDQAAVPVLRVYTATEEVYRGFSLESVKAQQALRWPFGCFRVQLEISMLNVLC
ncbi:hypothetical protein SAMN06265337_0636 [Hymenobacter gelipurpurascens]|uniref:Uncharacterized protein n=1 Tax=Hymenobacter gelipurpurascens TaxID=89968 RepID=A0A212T884_9BACT|nr:hypothetical protein [Hymenobacter gelipurpurascens]SNC62267.1 hypothetical protein SAMN06265337_0636 [Hymenobacter gelipurpurascens]